MKKIFNEKYRKYLPSKNFVKIMGSSIIVVGVIILLLFLTSSKEDFIKNGKTGLGVTDTSILGIIQKDTDGDTVPDWEEALWGTDKDNSITFDNTPDIVYIQNKKKELQIEQELNDKTITETEEFAREFFTTITALKSSGEVDDVIINNFSNALGQKIVNAELPDKYTSLDIEISNDNSTANKNQYYINIKTLFEKYKAKGLGDELDIINTSLISYTASGQDNNPEQLLLIANAYEDYAEDLSLVQVPNEFIDYHLRIINNSYNLSISVKNMAQMTTDPIVGVAGISQYEKYSQALVDTVTDLEEQL